MHSRRQILAAAVLTMLLAAGYAAAVPVPPALRAIELPEGATSIASTDPLMLDILEGATSTVGGTITWSAPDTFPIGKTYVYWTDSADAATVRRYVYVYPHGYQVLGATDNLRVFEHNGARHLLYDRDKRLHAIYNDGTKVWYRPGVRNGTRIHWREPVQVNDASTPIGKATYGTRGQTFAIVSDVAGQVVLQCVWSSTHPVNRAILTRRLTVDAAGSVTAGAIVHTNMVGSFQCIATDSTGRLHLAVEVYSSIIYAYSDDGLTWTGMQEWNASDTQCTAYRFPNLVIDSRNRAHLLWQAEGYLGYSGSRTWWVGLYSVRDPQTGTWSTPANILSGHPDWKAPSSGQQTLFAYPHMLIDDRDNLHLAWHGTAYSHIFAWDDTFYLEKVYNPVTDTWGPWTNYATLHKRDHFNTGNGEDANYTWVPSLAYKPGNDAIYALIMFGTGDDEVTDPAINLTDSILKTRLDGTWQGGFQNVIQTDGLRSWYANVPPEALVDPNGRTWLDMIWVDGTQNDYNVLFRRLDFGGGLEGDCNGDGAVDVADLLTLVYAFGSARGDANFDVQADLNFDHLVDVVDLLDIVYNFGRTN